MKIIFMGTPTFAVPILEAIVMTGHTVCGVISQPDREKDGKGGVKSTPIKEAAVRAGLPVHQFEKVSADGLDLLRSLQPDVIVTAAFGQLLKQEVLDLPRYGVLNVHASLLPKFRGSAPVQAALLAGEEKTGITIMQTELRMDTGAILATVETRILPTDTADSLSARLAHLGAESLPNVLRQLENGTLMPIKQDDSAATYTKKIIKTDGLLDFSESAESVARRVRAMYSWPMTYAFYKGTALKIHSALAVSGNWGESAQITVRDGRLFVACGEGALEVLVLQAPCKKPLTADAFLRGFRLMSGERFDCVE